MEWPRTQLGVVGDRGGGGGLRIELAVCPAETGDRLVCLHDEERVGTVARVFEGRLHQGGFTLPLAVKVQRDNALTDEAANSVAAKFDSERHAYRLLQTDPAGKGTVVRHYDFADDGDPHAPRLPPSLFCRHALHALEPLCPDCGRPLSEPRLVQHEERRLFCEHCKQGSLFAREDVKQRIVRRSVRQEGACDRCEQDDAACARSAHFLNFFSARLLTFERMDLDLADFLEERDAPDRQTRHPEFWAAYRPAADGPSRLAESLGLFRAVVAGVACMHEAGLTHFDIKPRNLCLRAEGGRLELRLIDLGFVDVPEESLAYLRQVQGDKWLDSDYAAPELSRRGPDKLAVQAGPSEPGGYRVVIRPAPLGADAAYDPLIEPGDRVDLQSPGAAGAWSGVVDKVEYGTEELRLLVDGERPPANRAPQQAHLRLRRHTGPAADLFSLGILLLEMLTGEANVGGLRDALAGALEAFPREPARGPLDLPWTPGQLAQTFARSPAAKSSLGPLFDRLDGRFTAAHEVAEELFGVALRLVYRSRFWALATYVPHRASRTGQALKRLDAELAHLGGLLAAARERSAVEIRAAGLGKTVNWLEKRLAEWRPHLPPPAATAAAAPFDREQLSHNLGLAARGMYADAALLRLLREYGNDTARLVRHARQVAAVVGPSPQPDFDLEPLVAMLTLGMTGNAGPDTLAKLKKGYLQVVESAKTPRGKNQALRAQSQAWIGRAEPLVNLIDAFDSGILPVSGLAERVLNLFIRPLNPEPARLRPPRLVFRLAGGLRRALGEAEAAEAVGRLRDCVRRTRAFRSQLEAHWDATFAAWERLPRPVRSPLTPFVKRVREDRKAMGKDDDGWLADANSALDKLEKYVKEVVATIVGPWDHSLRPRWYRTPRQGVLTFDSGLSKWHELLDPPATAQKLAASHLGPAATVQAHLLIAEFKVIEDLGRPGP